jgi:UDP-N-acetylmuramate dehydrogenase
MIRTLPFPSLAALTTLRMGGRAVAEVRLTETGDFAALPETLARLGGRPLVLGGGSNLLVDDRDLPVTLVRPLTGQTRLPRIVANAGAKTLVRVGAGLRLPALLSWCASQGLSGLEGLVGIPGRVGGAAVMNAGAYGDEIAPLIEELTAFTPEKGLHALLPADWSAQYRGLVLQEKSAWLAVTEVLLALRPTGRAEVRTAMKKNFLKKKAGQPLKEHTAGCVFKNPPGQTAGRLLEQAGMRGRKRGGLRFTEMHANFLAHDGGGTFQEATELIAEARQAVARQTGIHLELEIKVWSCRQL